jgi:hypothetical protein
VRQALLAQLEQLLEEPDRAPVNVLDTDILVREQVYSHLPSDVLEQFNDKGLHRVKGRQQNAHVFGIDRASSDSVADSAQST